MCRNLKRNLDCEPDRFNEYPKLMEFASLQGLYITRF